MIHPDEHKLELIAAGSGALGEEESAIRRHLDECEDCRRIFAEFQQFYADVADNFQRQVFTSQDPGLTLPVRSTPPARYGSIEKPLRMKEKVSTFSLAPRLVLRHPVVSSAGTLGFLALLGWWIASPVHTSISDTDPSYVRLNPQGSFVEVYNQADQLLWAKPSLDVDEIVGFQGSRSAFAAVLNVTGDRGNEVAVALKLGGDNDLRSNGIISLLDGRGQVLSKIHLGRYVSFAGKQYSDDYANRAIATAPSIVSGERLLVVAADNFHSPSVISVVDSSRRVAGEYWHYGNLSSLLEAPDLAGVGRSGVLCVGMNDAADTAGITYPMLVALDPQRVQGSSESSASRGFGFPRSSAEIAYIRFPLGDVVQALTERMAGTQILSLAKDRISVLVTSKSVCLEFVFSGDLTPVEVKSTESYTRMHERLKKEGKISSVLDRAYLAHIMAGIQFWDGESWKNERTLLKR